MPLLMRFIFVIIFLTNSAIALSSIDSIDIINNKKLKCGSYSFKGMLEKHDGNIYTLQLFSQTTNKINIKITGLTTNELISYKNRNIHIHGTLKNLSNSDQFVISVTKFIAAITKSDAQKGAIKILHEAKCNSL